MWHYIKAVLKSGWLILTTFLYAKKAIKHKDKHSQEERYAKCRKLICKVLKALDGDIHVEGLENLPDESFGLFSNHVSMIDPLVYISILEKKTTVVAKKEFLKAPFAPTILNCIDGKFIDRQDLKQSLKVMMAVQDDLSAHNYNWLIFPEGTRNKDRMKKLLEFHHGTFRPAFKAQAPIVPAVIFGTHELMSPKLHLKKRPVFVKFLKPLYYEDYKNLDTAEISKRVQSSVQKELTFSARPYIHHELLKNSK